MGVRKRDARRRRGHALLGCVLLCLIVLGSYVLLIGAHDPKWADWTCDDIEVAPGTTCLDVNMDRR